MSILFLTISLCILYYSEIWHDYYEIQDSKGDAEFNPKWHKADSWFHFILWCMLAIIFHNWQVLLLAMFVRLTVFQNGLNLKRGSGFFYLSNQGTDLWVKNHLGKYAAQIVFAICCLGIIIINLLN